MRGYGWKLFNNYFGIIKTDFGGIVLYYIAR